MTIHKKNINLKGWFNVKIGKTFNIKQEKWVKKCPYMTTERHIALKSIVRRQICFDDTQHLLQSLQTLVRTCVSEFLPLQSYCKSMIPYHLLYRIFWFSYGVTNSFNPTHAIFRPWRIWNIYWAVIPKNFNLSEI